MILAIDMGIKYCGKVESTISQIYFMRELPLILETELEYCMYIKGMLIYVVRANDMKRHPLKSVVPRSI